MLAKNDVLTEFKNVRSYERVDLLCSLLDLCLPYELRFLGTCLEFLGKRDFYELRVDERDANNVNHLASFRSLMDVNTRRKLVLYVSLLKACNVDCANCLNETLTALCIGDVTHLCRTEPENAEKLLDEMLLLYTIAVKHPAFSIHQKTEFAELLRCLEEEDHRLSLILYPNEENAAKTSRLLKPSDAIPETPCKPLEDVSDNSSQTPVTPQTNQLTCHVLSGSVYTSAVLPSALQQASASCLNPAHVIMSAVSSTAVQTPADSHLPETGLQLKPDSGHSVIVGLAGSPLNSSLMMGPGQGPGPGPGPGMVVPALPLSPHPPTSHCMIPSSGEMGIQKGSLGHPNVMAPMMCVPPDSIPMAYPGSAHYGMMVPLVGHGHVPLGAAPSVNKSVSSAMLTGPVSTPKAIPAVASLCPAYTAGSSIIENCVNYEESENQGSRPSSPLRKVPTPPATSKAQISSSKGPPHQQLSYQGPPNPYQMPPNVFLKPSPNHVYSNQIIPMGTIPFPTQAPQHITEKPPGQWHSAGDNIKEAIVREMPKYKSNLQDLSPDELTRMGDEQLKEIGLPYNAIQQLRSIMNKAHSSNGINCSIRNDVMCHENSAPRRRYYNSSDSKAQQGPPGYMPPCAVSCSYSGSASNGGCYTKGNRRELLQITNQVRSLQLEDDSRRPASNSSSTSDCSSGSHSPPETPSLPLISEVPADHFDKGCSGKDSGAESWNSATSEDKNKEERLQDGERGGVVDDRTRTSTYQHPGMQRNSANTRSRGISKAPPGPPGIPTMPRGRGHPMAEKNRRDPGGLMNGDINSPQPPPPSAPPFTISCASGMPSNVPYPPSTPASFIPHTQFTTMHTFHRFQSGSFVPTGSAYPFPPNGEMWSPFHQPPQPQNIQPTPHYMTAPIVAFSPAHPPPKLSCYNCGRQGHQGSDCKESTFEEITQQGQYHLDYKPGECRDAEK